MILDLTVAGALSVMGDLIIFYLDSIFYTRYIFILALQHKCRSVGYLVLQSGKKCQVTPGNFYLFFNCRVLYCS